MSCGSQPWSRHRGAASRRSAATQPFTPLGLPDPRLGGPRGAGAHLIFLTDVDKGRDAHGEGLGATATPLANHADRKKGAGTLGGASQPLPGHRARGPRGAESPRQEGPRGPIPPRAVSEAGDGRACPLEPPAYVTSSGLLKMSLALVCIAAALTRLAHLSLEILRLSDERKLLVIRSVVPSSLVPSAALKAPATRPFLPYRPPRLTSSWQSGKSLPGIHLLLNPIIFFFPP